MGLTDPSTGEGSERNDVAMFVHRRLLRPFLGMNLLFMSLPLVLGGYGRNTFINLGLALGNSAIFYGGLILLSVFGKLPLADRAAVRLGPAHRVRNDRHHTLGSDQNVTGEPVSRSRNNGFISQDGAKSVTTVSVNRGILGLFDRFVLQASLVGYSPPFHGGSTDERFDQVNVNRPHSGRAHGLSPLEEEAHCCRQLCGLLRSMRERGPIATPVTSVVGPPVVSKVLPYGTTSPQIP